MDVSPETNDNKYPETINQRGEADFALHKKVFLVKNGLGLRGIKWDKQVLPQVHPLAQLQLFHLSALSKYNLTLSRAKPQSFLIPFD